MSWSVRDYKQPPVDGVSSLPPPQTFDDSEALPTVAAYMGMEDEDAREDQRWTMHQARELRALGWMSPREWAAWGTMVRRGVQEV